MSRPRRADNLPAVVLGSGVNLIEVVRSLALAGIGSAIVAPEHDPSRLSRHTHPIASWDWSDPSRTERDTYLLERLAAFAGDQPARPPLLVTSDGALLFVSRHHDELAGFFRFLIPDVEDVESIVDKARFATRAEQLGLPVPRTRVVEPRLLSSVEPSPFGYPLIIKPYLRERMWQESVEAKQKAVEVGDDQELRDLWPRLVALPTPVVIQESVPGPESRLETYHVYVDAAGRTLGEFAGRKVRTMPPLFGHTTSLLVTDAQDVLDQGRRCVAALGLRGVAKVDFKRGPDGELYLLEVNPRFHLWHHAGALAGTNIPALAYADLTGAPQPPAARVRAGVRWVHPLDVFAARADEVPTWRWMWWARGCEAKAFWTWSDPLPLIGAVARRVGRP